MSASTSCRSILVYALNACLVRAELQASTVMLEDERKEKGIDKFDKQVQTKFNV